MTLERAMEILDPEHREHYDSIEPVNEACEIGRKAIEKQIAKKPIYEKYDTGTEYWYCPRCKEVVLSIITNCPIVNEYNHNHCGGCGQKLDWSKI